MTIELLIASVFVVPVVLYFSAKLVVWGALSSFDAYQRHQQQRTSDGKGK